jgi:hypothetical protein
MMYMPREERGKLINSSFAALGGNTQGSQVHPQQQSGINQTVHGPLKSLQLGVFLLTFPMVMYTGHPCSSPVKQERFVLSDHIWSNPGDIRLEVPLKMALNEHTRQSHVAEISL